MKSLQSRLQDIYKSQDEIPQLIEVLASDKKQLIKDYYVKLNIILSSTDNGQLTSSESVAGAKEEIELKDIFSQRDGKNNKILILGGAGVGKSTLMQYIANQWANDKLWHDKFDLVYKISLKQFLRSGCENFVNQYEAADNELNAFIAYNIENGDTKAARKQVENIKLDDDRVLLLVDGYDEVSHLDEMGVYKAVKDSILSQKNVIMTTRPNAADKTLKSQFGALVENVGLDSDGISEYLDKHFNQDTKSKVAIEEFLNKHPQIQEICKIPINIASV